MLTRRTARALPRKTIRRKETREMTRIENVGCQDQGDTPEVKPSCLIRCGILINAYVTF